MIVAGVMSGTSADGIDVAVCRIAARAGDREGMPRVKLLGHASFAYPAKVRGAVLEAMNAKAISVADVSRLHWRLGALYADAAEAAVAKFGGKVDLVGCHGQTIYHQGVGAKFLGAQVRGTWQIGEASLIAERMRVPVVSDFRPADMAAGGQGAPLVPMLDICLFGHATRSRVLQNIGGIGNLTAIPAGCGAESVMAFDTGPGNMVIDGCMEKLFGKRYDRGGAVARRGRVFAGVVERILEEGYFRGAPPKSCGREEFGEGFVERFIAACEHAGGEKKDVVAMATYLTAESILDAYRRFVWAHVGQRAPLARGTDFCVAGGGARNGFLMDLLRRGFEPLGVRVMPLEKLGLPAQAKEGVAFALLAWLTWQRRVGNVPAATGAARGVVLGKVTFG
jgi:anhydro-N-acetylmuramic acid kinase